MGGAFSASEPILIFIYLFCGLVDPEMHITHLVNEPLFGNILIYGYLFITLDTILFILFLFTTIFVL